MPVVKHSALVRDVEELPRLVEEAFRIAREGRPGPVLLDIPKDVLNREWTGEWKSPAPVALPPRPTELALQHARNLLREASRPLAYVGGGVRLAQAVDELRDFLDATGMPTVQTLKALGSLPVEEEQSLGMLGMHGLKSANYAVQECDLLVLSLIHI